nr:MAG TPA: hypothetical protein [Caudoviricetes sp.]
MQQKMILIQPRLFLNFVTLWAFYPIVLYVSI